MNRTLVEAIAAVKHLFPPGDENLYAWENGAAWVTHDMREKARAQLAMWQQQDTLRTELVPQTSVQKLPDWEQLFRLSRSVPALYGTTAARQAQIRSRWREHGASTLPNIQAAFAASLGYLPTIIETPRAALTAANTHAFAGLPVAIPASGTVSISTVLADNALSGPAGAQVSVIITHPHMEHVEVTILGPDTTTVVIPFFDTGAVTAKLYHLCAPNFAGKQITGTWQVFISDSGGDAGTWVAGAGQGIFVEGIGRDPLSGADGLGANIFEWSVLVDETLVNATTYDRNVARALVQRWKPAHTRGYLVLWNSSSPSTIECVFDDNFTPFDQGLFG